MIAGEDRLPGNPVEKLLRTDRMPHIWCSGCGIGTSVNCFARALDRTGWDRRKVAIVSGIGCSGRVAGYLDFDSFHTTHGRAIPFAVGLRLANPETHVVVYSGDGDLIAIGGNHFIHAARRNVNICVICINNFTYGMTGGQTAPTSPLGSFATTTPYGSMEVPLNLAHLADSCGATYVARYTTAHVRKLVTAMKEGMLHQGFAFIEVLSPCPTLFGRRNRLGDGLAMQQAFRKLGKIADGTPTGEATVDLEKGPIVLGRFVQRERAPFLQRYHEDMTKALGDRFVPYGFGETTIADLDDRAAADHEEWY